MLIDATHPEETRVVVVPATASRNLISNQLNANTCVATSILAKVTRVEPSLQAAFIEYGGNRHGFLAFSEIILTIIKFRLPTSGADRSRRARSSRGRGRTRRSPNRRRSRHRNARRRDHGERVQSAIVEDGEVAGIDATQV